MESNDSLPDSAVVCSVVQHNALQGNTVQVSAIQCSEIQCSTVQYSPVTCRTVQHGRLCASSAVHYSSPAASKDWSVVLMQLAEI